MNKLTQHGITLPELRSITAQPDYQRQIEAAEQYQPTDHERHKAAQIMFRDLTSGKRVANGEGAAVSLADVLDTIDGHRALVDYFRGKKTREEMNDLLMTWCLKQATAVIREEMVSHIEDTFIQQHKGEAA